MDGAMTGGRDTKPAFPACFDQRAGTRFSTFVEKKVAFSVALIKGRQLCIARNVFAPIGEMRAAWGPFVISIEELFNERAGARSVGKFTKFLKCAPVLKVDHFKVATDGTGDYPNTLSSVVK